MKTKKKLVSIIVPTYNEELVIGRMPKSLTSQTYKPIEIIVVDDGSFDKTVEIAKKYTKNVFERKHAERSVQRNYGARRSNGYYLMFMDADMEFTPKVIQACIDKLSLANDIGGLVVKEESVAKNYWEKVKAFERSFYNIYGDGQIEAARCFTRKVFNEVGGFDETITGPEDWDFPEMVKKHGYRIERINEIIYHHERIRNPFMLAKKKYYYALKAHRYFKKHNISIVGAKTIYLLRPVFWKNWRLMLAHPFMTMSMFFMLTIETFGGGLGYLVGRIKYA